MNTVTKSPARELREHFAALGFRVVEGGRSRLHVDTWVGLHTGDRVRMRDGVHVGRVEYIDNSAFVTVRWDHPSVALLEHGIPLGELVKHSDED